MEHLLHVMGEMGQSDSPGEVNKNLFNISSCRLPGFQWITLDPYLLFSWFTSEEHQGVCWARIRGIGSWNAVLLLGLSLCSPNLAHSPFQAAHDPPHSALSWLTSGSAEWRRFSGLLSPPLSIPPFVLAAIPTEWWSHFHTIISGIMWRQTSGDHLHWRPSNKGLKGTC